ncbi:hypothetical protein EAI_03483 [Harpegnathos saltator]|uniref:Uncharacterized protein n=1 Tax=Harpegnathos saltator TaxID=610380 RepID=E2BTL9_HARSA|nr:hypothetical protein EAI_03483 [Harpegnathos saltator]
MATSNETHTIRIINVIALLCRKYSVSLAALHIIIKDESYEFNFAELAIAEELNNQLVKTETFVEMESFNFLNADQTINPSIPEPDDDFEDEDNVITISQDQDSEPGLAQVDVVMISNNDPDNITKSLHEVIQVKHRFSEDIPREKWKFAFRYWTRQDDRSKPIEISEEMIDKPVKRSARDVISKCDMFMGTNLQNVRNWARKIIAGRIRSAQLINKRVMKRFCEKRSRNEIVHDMIPRKWAIDVKNQIDPTIKFKA